MPKPKSPKSGAAPHGASSPFDDWENRAGVRKAPMHHLSAKPEGMPFSERLVAIMAHPDVVQRDDSVKRQILGKRLHSYNRFTSQLEMYAVIPASRDIAFGELPFLVPRDVQLNAFKIMVDESDHALRAELLTSELTEITGIQPCVHREPAFLTDLYAGREHPDRKWQSLNLQSFVCISETLITGILAKVPRDETVIPEIREIIADHARDEATHHNFYSGMMSCIWTELKAHEKEVFGPMLSKWIVTFLSSDKRTEVDWLVDSGFDYAHAVRVVNETNEATDKHAQLHSSARPTLYQMRKIGMLDNGATVDALGAAGLL